MGKHRQGSMNLKIAHLTDLWKYIAQEDKAVEGLAKTLFKEAGVVDSMLTEAVDRNNQRRVSMLRDVPFADALQVKTQIGEGTKSRNGALATFEAPTSFKKASLSKQAISQELVERAKAGIEKAIKAAGTANTRTAEEYNTHIHKLIRQRMAFATELKKRAALLPGGKAEQEHKKPSDFDPKTLARGMKVESEHTSKKGMQKEIAMDHLTEFPKYYEGLAKMETGLKKKSELITPSFIKDFAQRVVAQAPKKGNEVAMHYRKHLDTLKGMLQHQGTSNVIKHASKDPDDLGTGEKFSEPDRRMIGREKSEQNQVKKPRVYGPGRFQTQVPTRNEHGPIGTYRAALEGPTLTGNLGSIL